MFEYRDFNHIWQVALRVRVAKSNILVQITVISVLTLSVWRQEGNPVCTKLGVGLLG